MISQSGALWWAPDRDPFNTSKYDDRAEPNWMVRQFLASPKLPIRFYMDAGAFEIETNSILEETRHTRDVLLAKGYEVRFHEFAGGHDYLGWRGTLADALIYLLGK